MRFATVARQTVTRMRRSCAPSKRQSGQAAVEAAIVMPLFVFLILGTLQLALAHQARLLTKYAAYRAVRAGAIFNGSVDKMEESALAVLLPMISHEGASATLKPIDSPTRFATKYLMNKLNRMPELPTFKDVEVVICNPTKGMLTGVRNGEVDFDDPAHASGGSWRAFEKTKLAVQVTFNYRMPIPFANAVISAIFRAQQLPYSLRLARDRTQANQDRMAKALAGTAYLGPLAAMKVYALPIRATYAMRMQSNLFVNQSPIPTENKCVVPFKK